MNVHPAQSGPKADYKKEFGKIKPSLPTEEKCKRYWNNTIAKCQSDTYLLLCSDLKNLITIFFPVSCPIGLVYVFQNRNLSICCVLCTNAE
jgi:hypothetical protein